MPQINASPLTERLQHRLAHNLPAGLSGREALCGQLGSVLQEIANAPLAPDRRVPADGMGELGDYGNLHALHTALEQPVAGETGELSAAERQTVRFVAHLRDICSVGDHLVTSNMAMAVAHHEVAHLGRNLFHELLRELGTLPLPYFIPPAQRQEIASAIVKILMLDGRRNRVLLTHARLYDIHGTPPSARSPAGGIAFRVAAWSEKAMPLVSVTPPPGVDPATYTTRALDLSQAPCQISWVI